MHVRALALTGITALLLTACGGDDDSAGDSSTPPAPASSSATAEQSGPELAEAAIDALEQADAVRIQGTVTTDDGRVDVDLRMRGDDVSGAMALGGQEVQLVVVDGEVFMQAVAEFWAAQGAPPQVADRLDGVWVAVPAETAGGLQDLTVAGLVDELRSDDASVEEDVVAAELDGEPVWEIRFSDGSSALIAAEGEPYPLQMTNSGDEPGELRLSEFGAIAPIEAPEGAVDPSDLGG